MEHCEILLFIHVLANHKSSPTLTKRTCTILQPSDIHHIYLILYILIKQKSTIDIWQFIHKDSTKFNSNHGNTYANLYILRP
jgi:hypothetical protein